MLAILNDRRPAAWYKRLLGGDYEQVGFVRRNALSAIGRLGGVTPDVEEALLAAALSDPYSRRGPKPPDDRGARRATQRRGARASGGRPDGDAARPLARSGGGGRRDARPHRRRDRSACRSCWDCRTTATGWCGPPACAACCSWSSAARPGNLADLDRSRGYVLTATDFRPEFRSRRRTPACSRRSRAGRGGLMIHLLGQPARRRVPGVVVPAPAGLPVGARHRRGDVGVHPDAGRHAALHLVSAPPRLVDQVRDTGVPSAFDKAGTPVMGGAVMVGCSSRRASSGPIRPTATSGHRDRGAALVRGHRPHRRPRQVASALGQPRHVRGAEAHAAGHVRRCCSSGCLASPWSPLPAREATTIYVPFVKHALTESAWLYFPMVWLFVMLVGNAVNITDGLDGLAIVPSVFGVSGAGRLRLRDGQRGVVEVLPLPAAAGRRAS